MATKKKLPKVKKVILIVDPEQSAAALAVPMNFPGYALRSMVRKGTKATLTYDRVP